jgi:hypothetical protein
MSNFLSPDFGVGFPRNNQFFFQFKPKQTETQSVPVVFRFVSPNKKTYFFGLFRCFGPVSKQRNKQKFLETNRKKLQKIFLYYGDFKTVNFKSNRNSICFGCFSVCFFAKPQHFFFGLFRCSDQYRNNRNKQNLWYGELIRLIFYRFCCCFGWSFVCFGCFETPKLPVSILKRNNRNKRLVLDSAETSLSSSFGCFDTKLDSEDTLFWGNGVERSFSVMEDVAGTMIKQSKCRC